MPTRLASHVRRNAIAYVALFFALGGSGALAAGAFANHPIRVCANRRSGALAVARRCPRGTRTLVLNQQGPAGAPGPAGPAGPAGKSAAVAFGQIGNNGTFFDPADGQNLTATHTGTGLWTIMTTNGSSCRATASNTPLITPVGRDNPPYAPVAFLSSPPAGNSGSEPSGVTFQVVTGYVNGAGTFVQAGQDFDVDDECY